MTDFPFYGSSPIVMRSADSASGVVEGCLSAFGGEPDSSGRIIKAGAFKNSIDRLERERAALPMLWSHDSSEPLGVWNDLQEKPQGLFGRGKISKSTQRGREILSLIAEGTVTGISVGGNLPKGGYTFASDGTMMISQVDLHEASICVLPANRRARITDLKSARDLERVLHVECGLAKSAARRIVAGGWSALAGADESEIHDMQQRLAQAASELRQMRKDR